MSKKKKSQKVSEQTPGAWISMSTGIKVIALCSIVMAVLTAWQVVPALGWVEGLLWSLGYGVMVWMVFGVMLFVFRLLRKAR
ncbi:MAG: hypothetical protein GYA17_04305 [Chloroflexi bacterium]|nr:hypothetical protein [Anaerolineaceae bacterium]NMB87559.1 hypothetical protein [Chloroflexota bacterium]